MKGSKGRLLTVLLAGIFVAGAIGAGVSFLTKTNSKTIKEDNSIENIAGETDKKEEKEEVLSEDQKLENEALSIVNKMTLEEKIGQLFIIEVDKLDNTRQNITTYNENIGNLINKYNIGGVIYFSNNIVNREQVINLNNSIQNNSKTKLFISVDEEGGTVSRIGSNSAMGTTKFGNMRSIGDTLDESKAYNVGNTIGREIKELGFNLDFAPDADILTNPNNSEIGSRSFGESPEIVSKMSTQVVKGLQDNNVSATLKHFPGHGNSGTNSHESYTYTNQTLDEMRKVEFVPFKEGINAGVDFILVSHIAAPNVTGNKIPSSLNKTIITDVLRNELNYKNIIITDALNMKAVSNYYTEDKASVEAIKAGNDILLMVQNIDLSYNSVLNACKSGEISEERINESVQRIIKTKLKRKIISSSESN